MTFELKESEKRIDYTFRNKELLITAFTHSTYANVHGGEDNERLEFLGDSVLQMSCPRRCISARKRTGCCARAK